MNNKVSEKIYFLGSRLNNEESIILEKKEKMDFAFFASLEEVKALFCQAYDLLLAPSFKPSFPPSKEEIIYHRGFSKLIGFYPVILEMNKENYTLDVLKWKCPGVQIYQTDDKFFGETDYYHMAMRSGFLKTYEVLDIVHDIETTPYVGPDGNMVLRINKVSYRDSLKPQPPLKPFSEEEIKNILRKRGYL